MAPGPSTGRRMAQRLHDQQGGRAPSESSYVVTTMGPGRGMAARWAQPVQSGVMWSAAGPQGLPGG